MLFQLSLSASLGFGRLNATSTVSIIVRPREIRQEKNAFRLGLWRSLGATALVLAIAQLVILALGLRPLRRITQDISAIESGELERLDGHYAAELEPLKRNLNRLPAEVTHIDIHVNQCGPNS